MKNTFPFIAFAFIAFTYISCDQENKSASTSSAPSTTTTVNTNGLEVWAEQIESNINLTVPDDWAPEDWHAIFKPDRKKIYQDISEAVLSGKQKAYNFFTDSVYSIEQIKTIINIPDTISLIRIREKVYFDKENFKLQRVPNTLALYVSHHSDDGTFVGYKPLFYVKLNN